ncbi:MULTISPECIES: winged helix-turn-helix domain-containing protein [unclassified Streptomyces]|uniref:helix-turn-helix domain-containing protein n=1 Tax=unclassified Streptomyces TaxID=2593676 RepID=UPI00386340AA
MVHGRPDQQWTLSRIKTVIRQRFHKSYTPQGVRKPLIRHGFFCQVPTGRAVEREEDRTEGGVKKTGWGLKLCVVDMPESSSKTTPACQ